MERYLEISDVLKKIQQITFDVDKFYTHTKNNTLDNYYKTVLTETVNTITLFPIDRALSNLDPFDDVAAIHNTFKMITEIISNMFLKDKVQVEKDLVDIVTKYPTDDVYTARMLQYHNQLH